MDRPRNWALISTATTPHDLLQAFEEIGPLHRHIVSEPLPRKTMHVGSSITANPRYAEIVEAVNKGKGKVVEIARRQEYEREDSEADVEEAKALYVLPRKQLAG